MKLNAVEIITKARATNHSTHGLFESMIRALVEAINEQAAAPEEDTVTLFMGPLEGKVRRPTGDPEFIDLPSFVTSAQAFKFKRSEFNRSEYHFYAILPLFREQAAAEPEPPLRVGDRVVMRGELVSVVGTTCCVIIDGDDRRRTTVYPGALQREEK